MQQDSINLRLQRLYAILCALMMGSLLFFFFSRQIGYFFYGFDSNLIDGSSDYSRYAMDVTAPFMLWAFFVGAAFDLACFIFSVILMALNGKVGSLLLLLGLVMSALLIPFYILISFLLPW